MIKILVKKPLFSKSNSDYRFDIKKVDQDDFNEEMLLNLTFDDVNRLFESFQDYSSLSKDSGRTLSIITQQAGGDDEEDMRLVKENEVIYSLTLKVDDNSDTTGGLLDLTADEFDSLMHKFHDIIYALTRGGIEL